MTLRRTWLKVGVTILRLMTSLLSTASALFLLARGCYVLLPYWMFSFEVLFQQSRFVYTFITSSRRVQLSCTLSHEKERGSITIPLSHKAVDRIQDIVRRENHKHIHVLKNRHHLHIKIIYLSIIKIINGGDTLPRRERESCGDLTSHVSSHGHGQCQHSFSRGCITVNNPSIYRVHYTDSITFWTHQWSNFLRVSAIKDKLTRKLG